MEHKRTFRLFRLLVVAAGLAVAGHAAMAFDAEAAKVTARQNGCFKCHSVEKAKDGPAWHDAAAKLKGNPDAYNILVKHLTTGEKAKFPDGHEEEHKVIKVHDQAELKNIIDWILSL